MTWTQNSETNEESICNVCFCLVNLNNKGKHHLVIFFFQAISIKFMGEYVSLSVLSSDLLLLPKSTPFLVPTTLVFSAQNTSLMTPNIQGFSSH